MRTVRISLTVAAAALALAACGSSVSSGQPVSLGGTHSGTLVHTGTIVSPPPVDVAGRFRIVGGPAPGVNNPLDGQIEVLRGTPSGPLVTTATATHGRFTVALKSGSYVFVGKTPQVTGAGPGCTNGQAVTIDAGHTTTVTVQCDVP